MPGLLSGGTEVASEALKLSEVVTSDMLYGVMDEILGLLPVVMPVSISFMAIRKGIKFVLGALARA